MSKFEFPSLEGWIAVAQVAEELKVSRQAIHKMLDSGVFNDGEVCQVGVGVKPFYLISSLALDRLLTERKE